MLLFIAEKAVSQDVFLEHIKRTSISDEVSNFNTEKLMARAQNLFQTSWVS